MPFRMFLALLALVVAHSAAAQTAGTRRQHEAVVSSGATWTITSPTLPRNESVRIENVGSTPVSGVRLIANDRDWTTIEGLLAQIVRPGMSDDQKARAIWQFVRDHAYHWYPVADFALDATNPIRFFHFYGYGFCSDTSGVLAVLFQKVGFPVRWWNPGNPPNHVAVETYYDGRWHLFDADRRALYLLRDNTTVAGVTDLISDPWLVTRAGAGHDDLATLYRDTSPAGWRAADPLEPDDTAPLDITLRPREAVTLRWANDGLTLHRLSDTPPPPVFANGTVETTLLPDDLERAGGTERQSNVKVQVSDSTSNWTADDAAEAGEVVYRIASPYPIVAADLDTRVTLAPGDGRVELYASRIADDVRVRGSELGAGGFRIPGVTVSDNNISTYGDDGAFPLLHTTRTGEPATMVFRVAPREPGQPIVVGGTFYRETLDDEAGISVSTDGVAWTRQWTADDSQTAYFAHRETVAPGPGNAPLFVRIELVARSYNAYWTAGMSELTLEGIDVPVQTLVWSSDQVAGATGSVDAHVDLADTLSVRGGQVAYRYRLRAVVTSATGATAVESLRVTTTFQSTTALLPGVGPGDTRLRYEDASAGSSQVKVTHTWIETGRQGPAAPVAAQAPVDGGVIVTAAPFTLAWQPAFHDADVPLFQHHVQVCADATCGSVLAAPFDIYTSGEWAGADGRPGSSDDGLQPTAASSVSVGLGSWLIDGRTYFWRVRAQDVSGTWGPFSAVWRFVASGQVALPLPDLAFTSEVSRSTSPLVSLSGTAGSSAGLLSLAWWTDRGASGIADVGVVWTIDNIPVAKGTTAIFVQVTDANGRQRVIQTSVTVESYTYYLAEGVTGSLFDTYLLVMNPVATPAPMVVEYYPEGRPAMARRVVLGPLARLELRLDDLWGEQEAVPLSIRVTSLDAVPLVVERAMYWGTPAYGGHAGRAVAEPRTRWLFAEGSQGFFDTYLLLQNPGDAAANVNVSFSDDKGVLERQQYQLPARSRFTVAASQLTKLAAVSFSIEAVSDQPIVAERSMYFGTQPFWRGGHGAVGVAEPRRAWLHAEGATGPYFDTYILLANPNDVPATVDVDYLTGSGERISRRHVVASHARETINVEYEDPRLADVAVSTQLRADVPIVTERAMYWPGTADTWQDAHIGTGTGTPGVRWGLAGGRVGTALAFETYLLLTNQEPSRLATVKGTFIRDDGTAIEKTWTVEPGSRFNVHVNSMVPELADESFSVVLEVTNGVPIAAERAMYWSAGGVTWVGGTSIAATPLP